MGRLECAGRVADRLKYGWIIRVDELPGHIGPYEVRDRLGHGGMGVVYLGFDPMLDRPVAIKVLKVPDEETRRRFLREARLAARVHHPHIVSIYAVGEHEGNPYLAMEFIAGRTMAQVIRGGEQVPLARKVHWLSELCAGLGHAHESGIVHRDVKPSNLLIAQGSGMLRLLDFGIAHGNEASSMTMAGMIVGTPQYMSPEQITGQPVDARSDIFSVGAVAYELLTGRQAFGGDNLYNVSRQIVGEQPRPIESFVPDVPNALVKTIAKCLQKEPGSRAGNAKLLEREFLAIARRLDPEHTLVVLPSEADDRHAASQGRDDVAPRVDAGDGRGDRAGRADDRLGAAAQAGVGNVAEPGRAAIAAEAAGASPGAAPAGGGRARRRGDRRPARSRMPKPRSTRWPTSSPRHPALERLRKAHQERIDERQVAALTSRARQALQQDRLDEAESLLAEALSLAPDAADALALQQKLSARTRAQRIARLVAQASRALDQEDEIGARRAIERPDPDRRRHTGTSRASQARLAATGRRGQRGPRPHRTVAPIAAGRPPLRQPSPVAGRGATGRPPPACAAPSPTPPRRPPAPSRRRTQARRTGAAAGGDREGRRRRARPGDVAPDRRPGRSRPSRRPPKAVRPAGHAAGDGLLLRDPSPVGSHAETRPAATASTGDAEAAPSRRSPAMLAVAALVAAARRRSGVVLPVRAHAEGRVHAGGKTPGEDSGATTTSGPPPVVATPRVDRASRWPRNGKPPSPAPAPSPPADDRRRPGAAVTGRAAHRPVGGGPSVLQGRQVRPRHGAPSIRSRAFPRP